MLTDERGSGTHPPARTTQASTAHTDCHNPSDSHDTLLTHKGFTTTLALKNRMNAVARVKGVLVGCLFGILIPSLTGSEWFNEGKVPLLKIEASPEAMTILRGYRWEWGGNDPA